MALFEDEHRRTRDGDAVFISRREAAPLTQPISRRAHINHLIFSADGTRFPHEPHLKILPDVDKCLPGKDVPCVSKQKKRNEDYDKKRLKLDIFKVFGPKQKGMPPGLF